MTLGAGKAVNHPVKGCEGSVGKFFIRKICDIGFHTKSSLNTRNESLNEYQHKEKS
jgi:hypothetical protein